MRIKRPNRPALVVLELWSMVMLTLGSGCTPLDAGEIEMFLQDLFLNALAAYLL